jgi:hypothetical protein
MEIASAAACVVSDLPTHRSANPFCKEGRATGTIRCSGQ